MLTMSTCTPTPGSHAAPPLSFVRVAFDDPLFILYTSGTTGKPKCIVQGFGAHLNHVKEHFVSLNLSREIAFCYTNTGWMVHSWLCAMLATKSTVLAHRAGAPFPPSRQLALWELAAREKITYFGAGAKLYDFSVDTAKLCDRADLQAQIRQSLRLITSTGSILSDKAQFHQRRYRDQRNAHHRPPRPSDQLCRFAVRTAGHGRRCYVKGSLRRIAAAPCRQRAA